MNPGIVQNVAVQFFLSTTYQVKKNVLACLTRTDRNIIRWKDVEKDHNSALSLKLSANLELLVNQFKNATPENSNDPGKISSSKYCDTEEMHNIESPYNNKS